MAYEELVDGGMNDASRLVDTKTWYAKGGNRVAALVATHRWRTIRCCMAASHCATSVQDVATADKQLGLLVFESLQNVPPVFDQRGMVPRRGAEWRSMLLWAQRKLKAAALGAPGDWELPFFLGKIAFKLGLVSLSHNLNPNRWEGHGRGTEALWPTGRASDVRWWCKEGANTIPHLP